MNKADKDKVIAALKAVDNLIKHQYTGSRDGMSALQNAADDCREALTIMRGLEDAEPVAICAVTPQGEVSIGWRHGYKPRHNENLYTSPQAAQTEGWTGDTEIDAALIMLDRMEVGPHDDDRLDEIAKLLRKLAGRAGRKG